MRQDRRPLPDSKKRTKLSHGDGQLFCTCVLLLCPKSKECDVQLIAIENSLAFGRQPYAGKSHGIT